MAVPYTFGTATASIPLSNLDSNFATTITLGNTAIQLGNTVTTLNNMTLANVTVSSGNVTFTNVSATLANVTTANIGTAVITGTSTLTGLTASTALALDASKNIVSVTNTGTGNNVLGTSPTIATPTISTITSAASTALTLQSNNGTTAVTVDTSQNVGIGTTSMVGKLNAIYSGTYGVYLQGAAGSSTLEIFFAAATNVGSISTNGTITAFNSTSDYRLKENIEPMTGALAKVAALKPVTYKWKSDGSDSDGFIAHELAEVFPQAVHGEKDGTETIEIKDEDGNVTETETRPVYQGIDTSFLVATLTAAIQELTARVAALEAK